MYFRVTLSMRALLTLEKKTLRPQLRLEKRWDDQTDGRTPDRCITLTARRGQRNQPMEFVCHQLDPITRLDKTTACDGQPDIGPQASRDTDQT